MGTKISQAVAVKQHLPFLPATKQSLCTLSSGLRGERKHASVEQKYF